MNNSATRDRKPAVMPNIRFMFRRDMPVAREIDRLSYTDPWTEKEFLELLRCRRVLGMVAEVDCRVVGNMIFELRQNEIFVVHFAVHPDFRRCGVGSAMSAKVASKLGLKRSRARTSVRETSLGSLLFMKAAGWTAYGVTRDAFGPGIDGFDFELKMKGGA